MLEKIFGSKLRVKLLRIFLNNPGRSFTEKELAKKLKIRASKMRPILTGLFDLGFLGKGTDRKPAKRKATPVYAVNTTSFLYPELHVLFLKSDVLFERDLVSRLSRLGNIFYLAITGGLIGVPTVPVDIFIVGRVNHRRLRRLMKSFDKELEREINYAIMSRQEFEYRRSLTDRFLYSILEGRKIVVINRLRI